MTMTHESVDKAREIPGIKSNTSFDTTAPEGPEAAGYGVVVLIDIVGLGKTPEDAIKDMYECLDMPQGHYEAEITGIDTALTHDPYQDGGAADFEVQLVEVTKAVLDRGTPDVFDLEEVDGIHCTPEEAEAYA